MSSRQSRNRNNRDGSSVVPELARAVNLESVRLLKISSEFHGLDPGESPAEIDIELQAGGGKASDAKLLLHVLVQAHFRFKPSKESKKVLAELSCAYVLSYRVQHEELFSRLADADIAKFAAANGLFNAWPYFRESCQSILGRMELGPVVLPSFRYQQLVPASAPTSQ